MTNQEEINQIVNAIIVGYAPKKIILFGSYAQGTPSRDSDIDLLVLAPAPDNTAKESVRVGRSLSGLGYPFDTFIMPTERFEESKNIFGGLAYPAYKYGRTIYEAA